MAKAPRSGIQVATADVPTILGMLQRNDRKHDIAAWFGLNQGRIAQVESGDFGSPPAASADSLPPSGSPGPRARDLRTAVKKALKHLHSGNISAAQKELDSALKEFDKNI